VGGKENPPTDGSFTLYVVVLPLTLLISVIFEPSGNLVRLTNDTIRDM